MSLLYPFLVTGEGIKTNVLGKNIFFRFILLPVLKENHSSKKVTILKDINERRIYRTERGLSFLKIEILLDDQLTENDKTKFKQDIEIEICSYSPITFLHKHRFIVQTPCEEEFGGKVIKDGTMIIIFFSQYEWTNSLIDVSNKIIIDDIFAPFIVSLNAHIIDVLLKAVLIKPALTNSPLLIIKENINCGNFLNKDRVNFFTGKVNYMPLIDFPQTITVVDERLYGETLFSQNEIYSNTYKDRIMADIENFLNSTHLDRLHHDCSNTTITQQEHKRVHRDVCFIIYT